MGNNLLNGDKTITVPKAKKVVECSKGSPECESPQIICKVKRDGPAPGTIDIIYNPKDIANGLPVRRKSGPSNVGIKNVGPIPCQICADSSLSNGRTAAMDALLYPAIRDQDDQTFRDNHEGLSKSEYLQQDMVRACLEWMGGSESGIGAFYNLAPNLNRDCGEPYVLETGALRIVVTVSMNVYWFTNNCVRQEKTLTTKRTVSISSKSFEFYTIKGARVSFAGYGGNSNRYGIEYNCPKYKATLICGTCYYTKDVGGFLQPFCFDPSQAGVLEGLVARPNKPEMFDKAGNPFNPFTAAIQARDSIASEIDAELPAKINGAVQELIGEASAMGSSGYIGCTPVCGLGYQLDDSIDVQYIKIGN